MVLLMDLCLKNYEKAELSYISAFVKASEFQRDYKKFADHVNHSNEIYNNSIKAKTSISEDDKKLMLSESQKATEMTAMMDKASIELLEIGYKAKLYQQLKYIWIVITALSFIICSIAAFIGFRGWYLSENSIQQ